MCIWFFTWDLGLLFRGFSIISKFVKTFHWLVLLSKAFALCKRKGKTFMFIANHARSWLCYVVLNWQIVLLKKLHYLHIFLMDSSLN
jgi:hypothetical protein